MSYGWCGQYLDVDLSSEELTLKSIDPVVLREVIGGMGLAAELAYQVIPGGADPLSPENALIIAAGPLGGTTWAGSGRMVAAGRSPLTGLWGESSAGGYFSTQLKRCGLDALVIRGQAAKPRCLVLINESWSLQDASHLWGMETYATETALVGQFQGAEVLSIGPAGEKMVPMASLVHHMGNNIAARCGLGAVAGSKRLKAIVARGTLDVPIADQAAFNSLKREAIELFNQNQFLMTIRMGSGTAGATPIAIDMADMTAHNWDVLAREWGPDSAHRITGPAMKAILPAKKDTCYACPIACKWMVSGPLLEGGTGHLSGPEYETISGLGSQVDVDDPLKVIQVGDLCNRLGLDTISAGSSIAWLLELHEKGLLPPRYIDPDLDLRFGDPQLVLELVRRIAALKPGLGALLAMGTRKAAQVIGAGMDFAIQVKGLELPFHHPRAMRGLEIAYSTLPRGGTHNEEGSALEWEDGSLESWVADSLHQMNLSGANSMMVYCQFLAGALNASYTARLLTAVTGVPYTESDLIRAGERAWYLRRAFNLRLGIGLEEDTLPKKMIQQIADSGAVHKDFNATLVESHRQRELDGRGVPSARKLTQVGLSHLVKELDAQ